MVSLNAKCTVYWMLIAEATTKDSQDLTAKKIDERQVALSGQSSGSQVFDAVQVYSFELVGHLHYSPDLVLTIICSPS